MSGSRTAIISDIGGNNAPTELNMSSTEEVNRTETTKRDKKNDNPIIRSTVPLSFKLKLIAEVKKHEIIWQDLKHKKNQDLIDDAWQRVQRALHIKNVGFCEKHWKHLVYGYRNHVNRKTSFNSGLVREMAFMTSQLKKSGEESESDAMELESPAMNKTPKPKKAAKRNSVLTENDRNEDQRASVAILELLFAKLPADVMRPVRNSLIEVFIKLMPDVDSKISVHAKQQVMMGADINKLDWSALDIPAEICKAVWEHKVKQMVLNV